MNMFELSAFGSPVVGIITGAQSTQSSSLQGAILGAFVGFVIGSLFYSVTMALNKYVYAIISTHREKDLGYSRLLVGHIATLVWTALPFAAWPVTFVLVKILV